MISHEKWKLSFPKNLKTTCIACIIFAVLAHLFVLTNIIHNHDSLNELPNGYGSGLISGRWLLAVLGKIAGKFWGNYNLPSYNNILSICILTITACIVVLIFNIQRPILCTLIGGIFIVAPPITSMLFYAFTSPYYSLSILLAIAAVWFTDKYKLGFIPGAVMCACSLGIYQAYLPITIALFVLLLIQKILKPCSEIKVILQKGFLFVGTLILSLLIYFLALQIQLKIQQTSLGNYQNINEMGKIDIHELPSTIKNTYYQFIAIPFKDYCGMSCTLVLKISLFLLDCISVILVILLLFWQKRRLTTILSCFILCAIFPLAANSIMLMAPHSSIYTLMVYGCVSMYLFPIILIDLAAKDLFPHILDKAKRRFLQITELGVIFSLSVAIWNYVYLSNGNYTAMYYTTQQANNYLNSLITQIRMVDGYQPTMEWAFIGENISDPLHGNPWNNTFNYGGNLNSLINVYSRNSFFHNYTGLFPLPLVSDEALSVLNTNPVIKNMPCYPADGSIQIYQDIVVVKLEDIGN